MSDLLDLCSPGANAQQLGPCAEVRVGDRVTRYVRRGSGSPIVLLGANPDENSLWRPLVDALVMRHRVVAPQMPPSGVDDSVWLRGFIEGLGLSSVILIASGAACAVALELAVADDFTVQKLVVVLGASSDGVAAKSPEALPDPSRTLWIEASLPAAEAVSRIERFILDASAK